MKENIGDVVLKPETKMLQDVVVTQSKARTRETPIAMSEITAAQQIEAKLGNKEFPEVLKMTPESGRHRRAAVMAMPRSTCADSRLLTLRFL